MPDVLAPSSSMNEVEKSSDEISPQSPQAIYKVIGGRKHIQVLLLTFENYLSEFIMEDFNFQKSEASMQTESSVTNQSTEQQYDWKKAMAHNARVLSSQVHINSFNQKLGSGVQTLLNCKMSNAE